MTKVEQMAYLFLATGFEGEVEPHLDPGEKISVSLMTLEQVKELCSHPKARHLPKEIFANVSNLEQLENLPEFKGQEVNR